MSAYFPFTSLTHHASVTPTYGYSAKRSKVVFTVNRLQFGHKRQIWSEASKRFDEAGDPLRSSIENAVISERIVKAISKCPVWLSS